MKKIILVLLFLAVAVPSMAQCVAEIKDVIQDEEKGSIKVLTEYVLNGEVVQTGTTRYTEESGTNDDIIAKAKEDIKIHCDNLVGRIEENITYIKDEILKINKDLTTPIIPDIKAALVGYTDESTGFTYNYKGKKIKVTHDKKNTVTDNIVVE